MSYYDDFLKSIDERPTIGNANPKSRLDIIYQSVADSNPHQTGKVLDTAHKLNAHPAVVQNNMGAATLASKAPNAAYWQLLERSRPATTSFLLNPENMASSYDLVQEHQHREGFIQKASHAYKLGDLQVRRSVLAQQQMSDVLQGKTPRNEAALQEIEKEIEQLSQNQPEGFFSFVNQIPNTLFSISKAAKRGAQGMASGAATGATIAGMAGQMGPQALAPEEAVTVPGAAAIGAKIGLHIGATAGYAEGSFALEAGSAYRDFLKIKGVDKKQAAYYALAVGAVNAGLEVAAVSKLLKAIPGGKKVLAILGSKQVKDLLKKKAAKSVVIDAFKPALKAAAAEIGTEVMQETTNVSWENRLRKESGAEQKSIGERVGQVASVVKPTFEATVFNPLVWMGIPANGLESYHQIQKSKQNVETYKALGNDAKKSEYLKRVPYKFKELAEAQLDGSAFENVYVDKDQVQKFFQESVPDVPVEQSMQIFRKELGIEDQTDPATQSFQIKMADWIEKVVPTPLYDAVADHVKFDPEGLTVAQAKDEEVRIKELTKQEQERAQALIAESEERQKGYELVYNDIKTKLQSIERPANIPERAWPSVIDKQARMWAAHAVAESVRQGKSIEEWYQGQNNPDIVKVDFMPSQVPENVKAQLNDNERTFLESLAGSGQSIEAISKDVEKQRDQILNDQIKYLQESGGKGVEQGKLIYDADGNVIDRAGRVSKNPLWYRNFYAKHGRAPRKNEYKKLAIDMLRNGYDDEGAQVPANEQFIQLDNTVNGIKRLKDRVGTLVGRSKESGRYFNQPMNLDVDLNTSVSVVDISNVLPFKKVVSNSELLSHIKNLAQKDTHIASADQKAIFNILPKKTKHITYSSDRRTGKPLVIRKGSLFSIVDLMKNAVLIESVENTKRAKKPDVDYYHYFYVPVSVGNNIYTVKLVAEERQKELTVNPTAVELYDVFVANEKPVLSNRSVSEGNGGVMTAAGSTISIGQMLKGVKDADGRLYYQGERGFVQIGENKSLIALMSDADASTFLHESAHLWLNDIHKFIKTGQADEAYLSDWKVLSDYLEYQEGQEKLTIEQQEKFASAFEQYLREGKSPSEGLRKIFGAFRRWLTTIYRSVKGLNVELSDDVRGVMDRMLATEDEIREREVYNDYTNDLIKESDVSPQTWRKLQDLKDKAHEMAIQQLLKPQMDELSPEHQDFMAQERERLRKIIGEEVQKTPLYVASDMLGGIFGRNKSVRELAERYIKNDGITDEGITQFEAVAEANGFSSGDELAKKILTAPTFTEEVNDRLEMQMAAEYGDLRDSENIKYEAEKAVRSDERIDALAMERAILLDLIQKEEEGVQKRHASLEKARILARTAKKYAEKILNDKPYREAMAATSYFAAERQAAVAEAGCYNKKDYENANKFAEQRILNHALALRAMKIKTEAEKMVKYLETTQKKKKDNFKKESHFNQAAAILERFGLGRKDYDPNTRQETLTEWAERMDSVTNTVNIADWLKDETITKNYKDLTIDQMHDVINALKNITQIANLEDRTLVAWNKADFADIAAKLQAVADENFKKKPKVKLTTKETGTEKLLKNAESARFALLSIETILRKLDGYKSLGAWWKTFYEMFDRAANDEAARMDQATAEYKKILSVYTDQERKVMENKLVYLNELNESLTKNEILAIALNWGNEVNRERLLGGRGWDEDTIKGLLEKNLDKRDWEFVQNVWDFINGFWPDIAKLHEELAGFTPGKVEADGFEVNLPDGSTMQLQGGYYPLKRDYRVDVREAREHNAENPLYKEEMPTWKAATKQGHTKTRAEAATYPVMLDLNIIQRHVTDVIHDLTYRKAVIDFNRMINNQDIQRILLQNLGMTGYATLENWGKAAAGQIQQPTLKVMDRMANWTRRHTVIFALGGRIGTMFQNMVNFSSAVNAMEGFGWGNVGHALLAHGIVDYYGKSIFDPKHAGEIEKYVFDRSQFMKDRSSTFDRDISDMTKRMFAKNSKLQQFAMAGYSYFDRLVNIPLWMEAYKVGLKETGEQEKAVQYADSLVRRTAGSGRVIDMPEIMRGSETQKLFTMFYSFMNTQLNLSYEAVDQLAMTKNVPKFLGRLMALWIIPTTIGTLMAFKAPKDDDDKVTWWLKQILTYPFQLFPVVRDVANLVFDKATGSQSFGFRATPATGIAEAVGNLAGAIHGAAEGTKTLESVAEATGKVGGYLAPYPDQFNNWFWNVFDYIIGEMEPEFDDILKRRPASER